MAKQKNEKGLYYFAAKFSVGRGQALVTRTAGSDGGCRAGGGGGGVAISCSHGAFVFHSLNAYEHAIQN
jgi:hypothetical protein